MKKYFILILFSFLINNYLFAQNSQLKLSKLGDPKYFENCVKYLGDEYLFESINLELPGLEIVRNNVAKKDFQAAYEEWGKYWDLKDKPKIVADLENQIISYDDFLKRADDKLKTKIISEADKILNNEIMGWGTKTIKFGEVIDFNANYGESGKYGFHYFYWSRSLYLAKLFENDIKYTAKFDDIFKQWYDQRYRVSYFYPEWDNIYYELGLGMRNTFFMINYCFENPARNWIYHEKMLKTMLGSGNWYYQMEGTQPYTYENRQLVAVANMGMLGLFFPEFKDSKKWIDLAYEKTMEHLEKDFFKDGANIERSPNNYTVLTYNCIRNFYYELKLFGYDEKLLSVMKNRLMKTIDNWCKLVSPTGNMPPTNDSQRSRFPHLIFIDAVKLYGLNENMGILNSIFDVKEYSKYPLPKETSVNLPISGYALMRNDWSKNSNYMSINYGAYSGGHSHYDMLDFDIYAFKKSLAIEASMGWTYDDTLHFPWYKKSISHNMIIVNDSNINKKEAIAENPYWMTNEKYDYFSAVDKKGFERFGVLYKRHFLFIKPDIWIIYDKINSGKEDNKITWNIHLRGSLSKEKEYFKSYDDSGLIVYPAVKYDFDIDKGKAMVKLDKEDNDFEELAWLRFKKQGKGEFDFCSMIYPYIKSRSNLRFEEKNPGFYLVKDGEKEIKIYFGESSGASDRIKSDAEVIILSGTKGTKRNIQIINGSFLNIDGKEYIKENKKWNYSINK